MDQGRTLYQTVMLNTQLAFPGDSTVLRLFGQSQYDAARISQLKFPVLLRTTFIQVSKPVYKLALKAKGLKDSEIALLNTLADSIVSQDIAQQKAKKERSLAASQRIDNMNSV